LPESHSQPHTSSSFSFSSLPSPQLPMPYPYPFHSPFLARPVQHTRQFLFLHLHSRSFLTLAPPLPFSPLTLIQHHHLYPFHLLILPSHLLLRHHPLYSAVPHHPLHPFLPFFSLHRHHHSSCLHYPCLSPHHIP